MNDRPPDPSPAGEGGSREAADGWGGRRTEQSPGFARALRKRLTRHEVKLWNWLRESVVPAGFHFRRQVPIGPFIADFACLSRRLIVELDGEQHGTDEGRSRDQQRDAELKARGYRVLRFTNAEIDREKPVVLETIRAALLDPHPSPSAPPSPTGEGSDVQLRPSASKPPHR